MSQSCATAPTRSYNLHLYRLAIKQVFQLRNSLGDVTNATSAHNWTTLLRESLRELYVRRRALRINPAVDMELCKLVDKKVGSFLRDARNATIDFATAEWSDLMFDFARELALGDIPGKAPPLGPSASSSHSGLPVPPTSHTPSSGSGVPRPASPAAARGSGDRAVRSLPQAPAPQPLPVAAVPPAAVAAAR